MKAKLTDFEIGYVCGLLDAEGSITAHRQQHKRHMKDGTILLFYSQRVHINMNDKKIMDFLHNILMKESLKYSYYGPDKQNRYSIDLQDKESLKRFWQIFNIFLRIKPFENYIGCIL